MDAVKFVEERRRMFDVTGENPKYSLFNMSTCAEDVVKEVAEWSAAHPRKTRQSEFLNLFPDADLSTGTVNVCPNSLYEGKCDCARYQNCLSCKREFWSQEVEV